MSDAAEAAAWAVLDTVPDPEVPALSVRELGIVRGVRVAGSAVDVTLTPTYSGCPATEVIEHDVRQALLAAGFASVSVRRQRAPAWTTDWISASGRAKLHACGIVPPGSAAEAAISWRLRCPRCDSLDTERLAAFGSTACKALHRCRACGEPFDHFKPL